MNDNLNAWGLLRKLTWQDVLLVLAVLLLARVLVSFMRWVLRHAAEKAPPRLRLIILRAVPIIRFLIDIGAVMAIVPLLVEPTFRNVIALIAGIGLALAYAFKDYGSSLVAGMVTVLENTYQPGDWIEVDGTYGEVKTIGIRAVYIVTPDDTEVIIPHSRIWSSSVFNASSGNRSLLCVTDFYLHPDHDALTIRRRLEEVAEASSYRKQETPVTVIVLEKPWGTHYRLKAYVKESREQFLFITDLTTRGKEALRCMNVQFAQAPYTETGKTKE
jgi:small conductance mechanosensitive channel